MSNGRRATGLFVGILLCTCLVALSTCGRCKPAKEPTSDRRRDSDRQPVTPDDIRIVPRGPKSSRHPNPAWDSDTSRQFSVMLIEGSVRPRKMKDLVATQDTIRDKVDVLGRCYDWAYRGRVVPEVRGRVKVRLTLAANGDIQNWTISPRKPEVEDCFGKMLRSWQLFPPERGRRTIVFSVSIKRLQQIKQQ